jgi:hypothetical protein
VPVLVMHGDDDQIVPYADSAPMSAKLLKNGTLKTVFVLVVQSFVKVSALNALAPTQTEPPFAITQAAVLVIFVLITLIAVIKFRPPKVQV